MIVQPITAAHECLYQLLHAVSVVYHLYVAPASLGQQTVLADFREPTWSGYAPQQIPRWYADEPWALPAVWYADPLVWSITVDMPPVTVQGYYATDTPLGRLLWCEAAPAPGYVVGTAGQCITVYPTISLAAAPLPFGRRRTRRRRKPPQPR